MCEQIILRPLSNIPPGQFSPCWHLSEFRARNSKERHSDQVATDTGLQDPFAGRWGALDKHRSRFVVVDVVQAVVVAAVDENGVRWVGLCVCVRALNMRHTIQKAVLWRCIGYDATQKAASTAPWEYPATIKIKFILIHVHLNAHNKQNPVLLLTIWCTA